MEYKEGLVKKNNVSIFYRDYGKSDQEPILLVHGLGAQLVHWSDDLIDLLIKNNYRPISLLPNLGKVFERVVFNHLYKYCQDHNLLTWRNSGYKPLD